MYSSLHEMDLVCKYCISKIIKIEKNNNESIMSF